MKVMSRTRLAFAYLIIVTLGILGVWLGSLAVDSGDVRRWLGLTMLLGAVFGLVVIYRRDLRPSEREKEIEWQRIRARGTLRFVLTQVLLSQIVWFPMICGGAYELYKTPTWSALTLPPWWWFALAAIGAVFSFVWSLTWWQRQGRLQASHLTVED
jgi:hypothetical protein